MQNKSLRVCFCKNKACIFDRMGYIGGNMGTDSIKTSLILGIMIGLAVVINMQSFHNAQRFDEQKRMLVELKRYTEDYFTFHVQQTPMGLQIVKDLQILPLKLEKDCK